MSKFETKTVKQMRNRFACLPLDEGDVVESTDVPESVVAETHNIINFCRLRKPSIYLKILGNDLLAPEEKKGGVCVVNEEEHQYREALRLVIRRVLLIFKQRRAKKLEGFPPITRKRSRSPSKLLNLSGLEGEQTFPEFWFTFSSENVVENLKELRVLETSAPTTTASTSAPTTTASTDSFKESISATTSSSSIKNGKEKNKANAPPFFRRARLI